MWEILVEAVFSFGLFVNAVLFIPQIIKLYKTKNADSLSLITFVGFNLIQLFVILHGYLRQDYLLIFGTTLSFLTSGMITALILYYRFYYKVFNKT